MSLNSKREIKDETSNDFLRTFVQTKSLRRMDEEAQRRKVNLKGSITIECKVIRFYFQQQNEDAATNASTMHG